MNPHSTHSALEHCLLSILHQPQHFEEILLLKTMGNICFGTMFSVFVPVHIWNILHILLIHIFGLLCLRIRLKNIILKR
jgi:hypothetical protein